MSIRVKSARRKQGLTTESELRTIESWGKELFAADQSLLDEFEWHFVGPDTFNIQVYCYDEFVSFAAVISREMQFDDVDVLVGGFKGLLTPKPHQGKGFASRALREAERVIFDELGADVGVLLCFDRLLNFYENRGWERLRCPVTITQSGGTILWPYETMALYRSNALRNPDRVDLCGPPF